MKGNQSSDLSRTEVRIWVRMQWLLTDRVVSAKYYSRRRPGSTLRYGLLPTSKRQLNCDRQTKLGMKRQLTVFLDARTAHFRVRPTIKQICHWNHFITVSFRSLSSFSSKKWLPRYLFFRCLKKEKTDRLHKNNSYRKIQYAVSTWNLHRLGWICV